MTIDERLSLLMETDDVNKDIDNQQDKLNETIDKIQKKLKEIHDAAAKQFQAALKNMMTAVKEIQEKAKEFKKKCDEEDLKENDDKILTYVSKVMATFKAWKDTSISNLTKIKDDFVETYKKIISHMPKITNVKESANSIKLSFANTAENTKLYKLMNNSIADVNEASIKFYNRVGRLANIMSILIVTSTILSILGATTAAIGALF